MPCVLSKKKKNCVCTFCSKRIPTGHVYEFSLCRGMKKKSTHYLCIKNKTSGILK